jgi:aerobic-type carbon monoxide dehydrogenase small subunit (CoxS/CutS family)
MTDEIKIEKNIPIPTTFRPSTKYGTIIDKMEVGDSVAVEGKNVRSCLYAAMKTAGYKAVTRKVTNQGYGVYRIWRTE